MKGRWAMKMFLAAVYEAETEGTEGKVLNVRQRP